MLELNSEFGRADESRGTGPLFSSPAVCAGLSLELALKYRIVLDGNRGLRVAQCPAAPPATG